MWANSNKMSTYLLTYDAVSLLEKRRKMDKILPSTLYNSLQYMLTPVLHINKRPFLQS